MNIFKKVYCRIFQISFRVMMPVLPYREPKIFNSVKEIPKLLNSLGIKSVLLVTGRHVRGAKLTEPLEILLKEEGISCTVYSDTCANPTIDNVEAARNMYLQNDCQGIIAFGGGSPMDCAKAVGARIARPDKTVGQLKGIVKVMKKTPTFIAIPTTAGTGSEVTLAAVITDAKTHLKYPISDFVLIPDYAVLDPAVTFTLPQSVTAATGIDALTHAVEAYIGRSTSKDTRRMALEATNLIFNNIEKAYNNGSDYEARANMLKASYLAGAAFSKSYVGYIHAVAHTLGGKYNIPHGLANAVLMPFVLEEYGECVYKKLYKLGIAAGVVTKSQSYEEGAKAFIAAICKLNANMNIPKKLSGINVEDIKTMAEHADKEANPLYPVPKLMDSKQLEKIYYKAAEFL